MNYPRLLRRIRQRIFGYHDEGKGEKADRVLLKVKSKAMSSPIEKSRRYAQKALENERLLRMLT